MTENNKPEEGPALIVPQPLAQAIANYLSDCKYREVANMIAGLQQCSNATKPTEDMLNRTVRSGRDPAAREP